MRRRRHFTPFVVSCDDLLGKEADVFLIPLSMKLAKKWHRSYSQTVSFVMTRFDISLVLQRIDAIADQEFRRK